MNLIYAIEERIGKPEYFYGREKELNFFMKWIDNVPKKLSKSTAILSRRKKGKTALAERLYNIIYTQNKNIVPFYYEIMEKRYSIKEFAENFYINFMMQYLAFKTQEKKYIRNTFSYQTIKELLKENNLQEALEDVTEMQKVLYEEKNIDQALKVALSAPKRIAELTGEYIVQIIDEFQYLNQNIYDERLNMQVDIAGMYMSLAESKVAPVIATGSWVSWLKHILRSMLPARFKEFELKNFTEDEGIGAVLNYCDIADIVITEENAIYIANLLENDPFYISAVVLSDYEEKNLSTEKGIVDTIEFEITKGMIYWTWMEYILATFKNVNNVNAKKMVLFLAKNSDKEFSIKDVIEKCGLTMSELECEEKLKMLERGDLIQRGSSSYFYKGLDDGILLRVLRSEYEYLINNVERELILKMDKEENLKRIENLKHQIKSIQSKLNYHKGHEVEYYIQKYLKHIQYEDTEEMKAKVYNYQEGYSFKKYAIVKNNILSIEGMKNLEFDAWAEVQDSDNREVLVMECKNTDNVIGVVDVKYFINKISVLIKEGYRPIPIFYSKNGFNDDAIKIMKKNKIMWSDSEKWEIEFN